MEAELNRSEKSCERLKQNLKEVRVKLEGKDLTIEELNGKIEGLKVRRNDRSKINCFLA
jgi:septal ring factor EnvC (AmiA/AmiB activator)